MATQKPTQLIFYYHSIISDIVIKESYTDTYTSDTLPNILLR